MEIAQPDTTATDRPETCGENNYSKMTKCTIKSSHTTDKMHKIVTVSFSGVILFLESKYLSHILTKAIVLKCR